MNVNSAREQLYEYKSISNFGFITIHDDFCVSNSTKMDLASSHPHFLINMELTYSPVASGLKAILRVGQYFGIFPITTLSSSQSPTHLRAPPLISWPTTLPLLYSAYVLASNLTILGFAVVLFFRDLVTPEANLVEQFLDMVYHSHILITILVCISQARNNLPNILSSWERLELLFQAFENEPPRDRVAIRKVFRPILRNGIENFGNFAEFPIQILAEIESLKHSGFAKMCKWVTATYVGIIFVGAVSYFITISIKENSASWAEYLDEVSKIYVIEEACGRWTGIYVLFLGN